MNPIRTSAQAIITRDERLLVINLVDEQGDWCLLPGGGQHVGDDRHIFYWLT